MKANEAPEKLYIHVRANKELGTTWHGKKITNSDIEYTRTDAFIEKAAEWVSMNFDKIGEHYSEYVMVGTEYNPEQFIEDFKNYMEESKV